MYSVRPIALQVLVAALGWTVDRHSSAPLPSPGAAVHDVVGHIIPNHLVAAASAA